MWIASLSFAALAAASEARGADSPSYTIHRLGLTGPAYTTSIGRYDSVPELLSAGGEAAGISYEYDPTYNSQIGQSAWLFDGSSTVPVGLTGPNYTNPIDGSSDQDVLFLNSAGQAAGTARRYVSGHRNERAAWVYDPSTGTTPVGLYNAAHTSSDGYQHSDVQFFDSSGRAYGRSERFDSTGAGAGWDAWVYDKGTLTTLGLTGPAFTNSRGDQYSEVDVANGNGQAAGVSDQNSPANGPPLAWVYDGTTGTTTPLGWLVGQSRQRDSIFAINEAGDVAGTSIMSAGTTVAWIYHAGVITRVGLLDAAHTDPIGSQTSAVTLLNNSGQAAGTSYSFIGGNSNITAWVYDGHTTVALGFTDAEHTAPDGHQSSAPALLDDNGRVAGSSARFSTSGATLGDSAWLYTPGSGTVPLGLTDAEHTSMSGSRDSAVTSLNDAGPVAGKSERFYVGANASLEDSAGWSPWVYENGVTTRVGFTGGIFTSAYKGFEISTIRGLNAAGQAIGDSDEEDAFGGTIGQAAWFFDPTTRSTIPLIFSENASGYSSSEADYLGADGTVVGSYVLYGSDGKDIPHGFYWTEDSGMRDLGALVDGGLSANGWFSLYNVLSVDGSGDILGSGVPLSPNSGFLGYLLTPVPEPTAFAAAAVALTACMCRRRRS